MKTTGLQRFSVSMPAELVRQLDAMLHAKGFANRSQALGELVRARLVEHHQEAGDRELAGTITLVYDHHKPHLQTALTDIQHDHHGVIISTLHVHLDHHHCMEVLAVRGAAARIRSIADALTSAKGVQHGQLTITTTGRELHSPRDGAHAHS